MSPDLLDLLGDGDGELDAPSCSRAGCRAPATRRIEWRNPKIHAPERVKTWLACDEHAEALRGFLAQRAFPVRVRELDAPRDGGPVT